MGKGMRNKIEVTPLYTFKSAATNDLEKSLMEMRMKII